MKVYLSGSISGVSEEFAKEWRDDVSQKLLDLGYIVVDPFIMHSVSGRPYRVVKELKHKDLKVHNSLASSIVDDDIQWLSECQAVLARIENNVFTGAGVAGELTLAKYLHIPVFAAIEVDPVVVPSWMLGCITKISSSLDEAIRCLNGSKIKPTSNK